MLAKAVIYYVAVTCPSLILSVQEQDNVHITCVNMRKLESGWDWMQGIVWICVRLWVCMCVYLWVLVYANIFIVSISDVLYSFFHKKAGYKMRESPGIIRPKDCQNRVYKRLYIYKSYTCIFAFMLISIFMNM